MAQGLQRNKTGKLHKIVYVTGNPGEVQTNGDMSEFLSGVTVYSSCAGLQRKQVDQCEI